MTPVILAILLAQQVVNVTPTWVHSDEPVQEQVCTQNVPCAPPAPSPCATIRAHVEQLPGCPAPTAHTEMRSKALFWTGLGMVAGGATLIIGSVTWGRTSEVTNYPSAPCGTDPYITRLPIAPCQPSHPLLAAGIALGAAGAPLIIYGGQKVLVGADGRRVVITVKF